MMQEVNMQVKDLMTTGISCVRPEASLIQAAKQMKQENIGSIPVCNDKGEILGIVTDRDIVIRALSEDSQKNTVAEIMTTAIISATPNMNTHEAALLLSKYQIRRLPVVSSGKLVGMLSIADIARKTLFIDEAGDILSAVSKVGSIS